MHAHKTVVSALIKNAKMAGLHQAPRTPMLSGILADFLEQLLEIDSYAGEKRNFGKAIEENILKGSISMEKLEATNYPHFTYRPEGWKENLPLMNASSMVSELAPVVLYLRHLVTPNNVLIVEEPESHLHPAMQVEFIKQLAKLIDHGIRVIVTTHSEWLLEELTNIVKRSKVPNQKDVALKEQDVGVWLFKPTGKNQGSEVEEILLEDSGYYPSGFEKVATTLHNDWAEITDQIENQ